MSAFMHENEEHETHGESPAPSHSIEPDGQQHRSPGLEQHRQKLKQRDEDKLELREKLGHQRQGDAEGSEQLLELLSESRLAARRLRVLGHHGRRRSREGRRLLVTVTIHPRKCALDASWTQPDLGLAKPLPLQDSVEARRGRGRLLWKVARPTEQSKGRSSIMQHSSF